MFLLFTHQCAAASFRTLSSDGTSQSLQADSPHSAEQNEAARPVSTVGVSFGLRGRSQERPASALPPRYHGVSQSEPLGRKCNALSEAKMTVLLRRVEFWWVGAPCLWFCRRHTLPNCGVTSASLVICETAKLGGAKSRELRLHRTIL